jgi:methylthioribose-1-phosphate isomerase
MRSPADLNLIYQPVQIKREEVRQLNHRWGIEINRNRGKTGTEEWAYKRISAAGASSKKFELGLDFAFRGFPMIRTIEWKDSCVVMLDQRLLPTEEIYNSYRTHLEVAEAIRTMVIRGAPAIGIAAAMGIALGIKNAAAASVEDLDRLFESICSDIRSTRPTAVNLFWAIERMKSVYVRNRSRGIQEVRSALIKECITMHAEDVEANRSMGRFGQVLIPEQATILTHCNAGALATAGYGTALGVIRAAVEAGKKIQVIADETRPFLQGARLTAWELQKDNIPVTVITDNMAGYFMQKGRIDCVIVGADRIAANGDVANKIGTYSIAVLARENGIAFFVAAPISTLDLTIPGGGHIPIEERDPREVREIRGVAITPADAKVENPAFDVTPSRYVSAIITERGVARPPFRESLKKLVKSGE